MEMKTRESLQQLFPVRMYSDSVSVFFGPIASQHWFFCINNSIHVPRLVSRTALQT